MEKYETVVQNTSDKDIENFLMEIILKDEDDIAIERIFANAPTTWKKGEKIKLSFETNTDFEK